MPGHYYVLVSLALFFIGTAGALLRRNALFVLMSLELQLGAGSLALLAFARGLGDQKGHVVAFFIMALAAAEAAVGLAIVVSVYRSRRKIDLDGISELRN
jgi:NADH-quinone oxidoreductase subunit K